MSLNATNKLILAFITLVIGIVLITPTSSEILERTDLDSTVMERVTINGSIATNASDREQINTTWQTTAVSNLGDTNLDCLMTGIVVTNATNYTLTSGTDYNFNTSTGRFTLGNTTNIWYLSNATGGLANQTFVNYTYCPSGYLNLSWGRTLLNLVPGFIGIALLLIAVGLFYSFYSDVRSR